RDVAHDDVGQVLADVVADGVEEVGLAEAGVAVDEQRVVGLGRLLGHGQGGGVGEAVRLPDHEVLERVRRVQGDLGQGGGHRCPAAPAAPGADGRAAEVQLRAGQVQ